MKIWQISFSDMMKCPKKSLSPDHYNIDGSCKCKKTRRKKQNNKVLKNWNVFIIVGLVLVSAAMSGYYFGFNAERPTIAVAAPIQDDRDSRILSQYMDETVSNCYYDTYQQNDTIAFSGNVCNHAMIFFKEFCKTKNLEACNSDYLSKYLAGMGE